ncbi:MAG: tRNA (guanosine(37)-N1)-methyltransferase TrmD, partial [Bacteroidota bacterium]|nr:tRNA (guanosine(37)-N1)-methyltransferase TrmD [Bacteroidota bacterium]
LSTKKNLILLCGHYKGVDHRVRDYLITKEISIGNYVLSGGELPAAILCDSIIRLIPGVIGDESSALSDSFQDNVVSAPIYTRPANYKGLEVPDVLISGNQKEIEKWEDQKSLERTKLLRPKLFDNL